MRNEYLRKNIESPAALNKECLHDACPVAVLPCGENSDRAWSREHDMRARANPDIHLDMITGEETRHRIDEVDDQMIAVPIGLAQMNGRAKRLFGEIRSSRGANAALNAQMALDSAGENCHRRINLARLAGCPERNRRFSAAGYPRDEGPGSKSLSC